jgi:hypothetical protein
MKIFRLFISTIFLYCASAHAMPVEQSLLRMRINTDMLKQASQELTTREAELLKKYLDTRITQLSHDAVDDFTIKEKDAFEKIVTLFYQHRYDKLLQQLYALGYDPKTILHCSTLRIAMLQGKLEQTPLFLREVAGLDWFFEWDARRKHKKWPKLEDKLKYISYLIDQIDHNKNKLFDAALIRNAIDSLEKSLNTLVEQASASVKSLKAKTRFTDMHARLEAIRAESGAKSEID